MPLSIGKVRVDVSLCGAVPRQPLSWSSSLTSVLANQVPCSPACTHRAPPVTPSTRPCQKLSEFASRTFSSVDQPKANGSCVATLNGTTANGPSPPLPSIFPSGEDCVIHTVEPSESQDEGGTNDDEGSSNNHHQQQELGHLLGQHEQDQDGSQNSQSSTTTAETADTTSSESNKDTTTNNNTMHGTALFTAAATSAFSAMHNQNTMQQQPPQQVRQLGNLEPPRWAVPARGKARLEPVCEAADLHVRVDLSSRAFFRVGRSAGSDVQLLHSTSSRQHALLFHHPNGSCYIVDCGSSHGTFVNGVRVQNAPSGSRVVPHRVRRGSLIRFGGPGAPSFVLKSHSVGFSAMVDLEEPSSNPTQAPTRPPTVLKVCNGPRPCGSILRKRSFEDEVPINEQGDDGQEPNAKRQRCVSPPVTGNAETAFRLVSPDSPRKSRKVSFLDQPKAMYPTLVPASSSDVTAS